MLNVKMDLQINWTNMLQIYTRTYRHLPVIEAAKTTDYGIEY